MSRYFTISIALLISVVLLAGACAAPGVPEGGDPDSLALTFVRTMTEEHDATKAFNMLCSTSPQRVRGDMAQTDPIPTTVLRFSREEATNFTTRTSRLQDVVDLSVSPADKANGISDKRVVDIDCIYRGSPSEPWYDGWFTVFVFKVGGSWCIQDYSW